MEHFIAKLLQDFERGKIGRRELIKSMAAAAAAVASGTSAASGATPDSTIVKATYLNHVSHLVADYRKSRDWYTDLFGMKVVLDDGSKANLAVGESLLILKNRTNNEPPVDHICFTIANWDEDKSVRGKVEAELKRRGVEIERSTAVSLHIITPDGYKVQLGGKDQ